MDVLRQARQGARDGKPNIRLCSACLASCGPSEAAMRIWVVDDGLRINPQTGKAFEDNAIYPEALRLKP